MSSIANIQPTALWQQFAAICAIPHPSHHEEAVIQNCIQQVQAKGLEAVRDPVGNLIIRKPATPGMENCKGIVLQSHVDMVPQKNNDSSHNFETDPLTVYQDGDWVRATGTTLGADNGIGVAAIMALMLSDDIDHGPLEALLTINEEAGMEGALGLQPGWLNGELLLNLDTEEDGELYIGCAGGGGVNVQIPYSAEPFPDGFVALQLAVRGLRGGHSGIDIHRGRGNANLIANRILRVAVNEFNAVLASVNGGSLRNALARESFSVIGLPADKTAEFEQRVQKITRTVLAELAGVEANISIALSAVNNPETIIDRACAAKLIRAIAACQHGVSRMSDSVAGVVETSNNLAKVSTQRDHIAIQCLTRSLIDSARDQQALAVASAFELAGGTALIENPYPGWQPKAGSPLVAAMQQLHEQEYGSLPSLKVIHAGLECGILGAAYPGWDMVSFGPTITGAHSPDERVHVPSVAKFWDYLVKAIKVVAK